jgi:hypothetical protein
VGQAASDQQMSATERRVEAQQAADQRRAQSLRATEQQRTTAPPPSTGGQPTTAGRTTEPSLNGLAPAVRDVEVARMRLGHDLEVLNHEVRAQMGQTVEKLAWKAVVIVSALVAGIGTQKALTAGWRSATKHDPPQNPVNPQTGWGEALSWTIATAVSVGVTKVVATRAAAAGWQKATGELPPGLETR